jgi:hypothetical protein
MSDAGFDGDIEIVDADAKHPVHAREVDGHAAVQRVHVAFERRAGAKRHNRRSVTRRRTNDGAHLVGRQRKDDCVGLTGRMPRLAVTVRLDLRRAGRTAIADTRAEIGNEPRARVSGED